MPGIYEVAVFDSRIAGLFGTTGDVGIFARDHTILIRNAAIRRAPKRTMELARHHGITGPHRSGAYGRHGQVYNDAEHALWVHNGTRDVITPTTQPRMILPAHKGAPPGLTIARKRVSGQKANPWLAAAAREINSRFI